MYKCARNGQWKTHTTGGDREDSARVIVGMEGKGKKRGKPAKEERKDRRSATGMSGEPKKGGHGGKFTWAGGQRRWTENSPAVDSQDPIFQVDDEEEEESSSL